MKQMEITLLDKTSPLSRQNWLERVPLPPDMAESVYRSSVVFLPIESFRGVVNFSFPQGTSDLYQFLLKHRGELGQTELCITDDDYQELALYSREIRLGHLLVTQVVAPVLIGLLTNYIYDIVKSDPDDNVTLTLQVEGKCNDILIKYDGPAKDFQLIKPHLLSLTHECDSEKNRIYSTKEGPDDILKI
ncbi:MULTISPECIES: hypothetical protein [Enterobacteriaceae]|uniref:hypothetical protein n=1 Tax=Enterobacteriaceae TaxID=543 RepID=UPI001FCB83D6|nr:hypothetical protein [Enterobacter kobei]